MIPIALSGDRSYNKDTIRKYVMEGVRIIPGSSTIHFDEISKKRIFQAIDRMEAKSKLLKEKYYQLKDKLGRIPNILDFYQYGEIDPMLFINYSKTYDQFVRRFDQEYKIVFSETEEAILEFVSSLLINGKRPHELLMLQMLLDKNEVSEELLSEKMAFMGEKLRKSDYMSAIAVLNKEFINTQSENQKYLEIEFLDGKENLDKSNRRAIAFYEKLQKQEFMKELKLLVDYGLAKYNDKYKNHDEDNLVLYEKYSRKDVCRLLNWERDDSATMYGYRIKYNTCPIFVTYEKKDDIASSTKYEDQFVNLVLKEHEAAKWLTKDTLDSVEWLPADLGLVEKIQQYLAQKQLVD